MSAELACKGRPAAPSLAETVKAKLGANVFRCWQCVKCTAGCPVADQFDLTPNQVMRAVQLNDATALASRTLWLCASCHTCATRCPRGIDVTGVMDVLRIEAAARGVPPAIPDIPRFNAIFMRLAAWFGRVPETWLMIAFNLARGRLTHDAGLGWQLLRRGRLRLWPSFARTPKAVAPVADANQAVAYFPGCASEGTAADYDRTARTVAGELGIRLVEPEGWTCCGSSPAHATDAALAVAMPLRTVGTVQRMGMDTLTTPCSSCFARLKSAELEAHGGEEHDYRGTVRVQHLLDTFMERAGAEKIAGRVEQPLTGLKVACYYGCLITRPSRVTGAEHPEYPMRMDELVRSLGAEPVAWSGKTDCCGGSLGVTQVEAAAKMTRRVLANARDCGADVVATMCPMCHMNLDARQPDLGLDSPLPVMHATQLMMLAFGMGQRVALLDRAIVDARPVLAGKGID